MATLSVEQALVETFEPAGERCGGEGGAAFAAAFDQRSVGRRVGQADDLSGQVGDRQWIGEQRGAVGDLLGRAAAGGEEVDVLTVFVKGIPFDADEDAVKEKFAGCGTITTIDMPKFEDSGRSRGIARITFASAEEATEALKLHNEDFNGRYLSVELARPRGAMGAKPGFTDRPKSDPSPTVFLGNLSFDVDEATLRSVFESCGEIFSVRIATDRETGQPRGFGHIEFADIEVRGRWLCVCVCRPVVASPRCVTAPSC